MTDHLHFLVHGPPCLNDCRHQNPFELEGQILIVTCCKYRPGLHVATAHTEYRLKETVSLVYNENNLQRALCGHGLLTCHTKSMHMCFELLCYIIAVSSWEM